MSPASLPPSLNVILGCTAWHNCIIASVVRQFLHAQDRNPIATLHNLFCPREPVLPSISLVTHDKVSPTDPSSFTEVQERRSVQQTLYQCNRVFITSHKTVPRTAQRKFRSDSLIAFAPLFIVAKSKVFSNSFPVNSG